MILAEPSPSQGDLHFSLLGFPVRIHPWFWLVALLLSDLRDEPVHVVLWVVAMLLCILLHELGHAVVMQAYGYRPSIVLYSFGGLAIPHPGRAGVRRPGPWGEMLIAFAGPASGFILAAVLVWDCIIWAAIRRDLQVVVSRYCARWCSFPIDLVPTS